MAIKTISNLQELDAYRDWDQVSSASSLMDIHGSPIDASYQGPVYRLLGIYEKSFSTLERIGRVILGILATLSSLGVLLHFQSVKYLFLESKKVLHLGILEEIVPTPCLKAAGKTTRLPEIGQFLNIPAQEPHQSKAQLVRKYLGDINLLDSETKLEIIKVNKHGKLILRTYTLDKEVGAGKYGIAYKLVPVEGHGKDKVLKVAHKNKIHRANPAIKKSYELLERQFVNPVTGVLQRHIPGVLKYKSINTTKGLALSKYCTGNMFKLGKFKLSFALYCKYITQTAFAVNHFHTESAFKPGLTHYDLKPDNILYLAHKEGTNFFIIDFDGSNEMNVPDDDNTYTPSYLGEKDLKAWEGVSKNKALSAAIDVRLLGLCWAEALTRRSVCLERPQPVLTKDFLINAIMDKVLWPQNEAEVLSKICDLIVEMINPEWPLRPTMTKCVEYLTALGLEMPQYEN